jgi:putative thioredoxin
MSEQELTVLEVSQGNFNSAVILASHRRPVLVEFMGVWSEPCIIMADHLAALAQEFDGQFVFAKLDVDEQQALSEEYSVANVPTLKVFRDGDVVLTQEGQMQPNELRALLKNYGIYRKSDEIRLQAREQHMAGNTVEAVKLLTQAIQQDPANTRVAMDMVQIFLDVGELEQAKNLYNRLPDDDKRSGTGRILFGQLTFRDLAAKTEGKQTLQSRVDGDATDNDARFDLAICHVAENDFHQAMDHLFVIYEQSPDYKQGAASEMIISLVNMLAPNNPELAAEYRRRLGSVKA